MTTNKVLRQCTMGPWINLYHMLNENVKHSKVDLMGSREKSLVPHKILTTAI